MDQSNQTLADLAANTEEQLQSKDAQIMALTNQVATLTASIDTLTKQSPVSPSIMAVAEIIIMTVAEAVEIREVTSPSGGQ